MPTINTPITGTWTKVAETADANLLVSWSENTTIEVASTTTNSAPTVTGHTLSNDSAITRSVIGPGYIWAKTVPGSLPATITLVVSK